MSIRVEQSAWRDARVQWYGKHIARIVRNNFERGEKFRITDVAARLDDLSERYAYGAACAVLYQMQLDGKLERCGQGFMRPRKSKSRRRAKQLDGRNNSRFRQNRDMRPSVELRR